MFPCSLRYFANVPLFHKTPGRPSIIPREAGFIILSLKGLRWDEISCGVYGHIYLSIYLSVRLVFAENDVTRPCAGGLMV